jgi:hypothetical protein
MVRLGEKAHLLMINLPLKQALPLAQWIIAVEHLVNARLGFAWAVAVVMG